MSYLHGGLFGRRENGFYVRLSRGVQAALDKGPDDVLVPPQDNNHPIWWVFPRGTITVKSLKENLVRACENKKDKDILEALLSMAARKDGSPAFGILIDKRTGKPTSDDKYKKFLSESDLGCKAYSRLSEEKRQALIVGYFFGTEAYRVATKISADLLWTAWPLGTPPKTLRERVDQLCNNPTDADSKFRDWLWLVTELMALKIRPKE